MDAKPQQTTSALSVGLRLAAGLAAALVVAGLILYLLALWQDSSVARLAPALIVGVTAAMLAVPLLIWVLYLLSRWATARHARRLGVTTAPGISAYEQHLSLSSTPEAAFGLAEAVLRALPQGSRIMSADAVAGEIIASTDRSERSYGETVSVAIKKTPAGRSAIDIGSQPATFQLFDWGVNAENVAWVVAELRARDGIVAGPALDVGEDAASDGTELATRDWLALAYLLLVAAYTGFLILALELWPELFLAWSALLEPVTLSPERLFGDACAAEAGAKGHLVIQQLNLLITPTLVAYTAYNWIEFARGRERMGGLNWLFSLGSLVALPGLVTVGCWAGWGDDLGPKYHGLIALMHGYSAGAILYAVMLVSLTNGVSYLPAALLARLSARRRPKEGRVRGPR
ncbi:MAG: hypothetical protein QF893_15380 [Alphaproteobacteria bacterium]|jgi:hypothetical protein|nr:hypothetical protein [Alphaproteobacteria bacterium]